MLAVRSWECTVKLCFLKPPPSTCWQAGSVLSALTQHSRASGTAPWIAFIGLTFKTIFKINLNTHNGKLQQKMKK